MADPFCWYELLTPDTAAARSFYSNVVGWTADEPASPRPYTVFSPPGAAAVAGMTELSPDMAAQGARPGWLGFVAVADVDAAAEKAVSLGAVLRRPPTDIPDIGRFAVLTDPSGAPFSLFHGAPGFAQPPDGDGPGFIAWRELMADDLEKAWAFYSALFGWTKDSDHDMGPMGAYRLFKTGGANAAGGMMTRPPSLPASFWAFYFTVEGGVRDAAGRVTAGGGQVVNGPMQVPGGDWVLQGLDPQGAMFALFSKTE